MFEFFAPLSGKVMELNEVPNQVFASKMAGDGVAIDSVDDLVLSPADGQIAFILKSNHAFCMKLNNGILVIVHIGIDTVQLNGDGFERLVEDGAEVKAGDPIIKIDRKKIIGKGYSLITPVLITNMELVNEISYKTNRDAVSGSEVILTYTTK